MKNTEKVLFIVFLILALVVYGVLLYGHDLGMDKACMDESWWAYVR